MNTAIESCTLFDQEHAEIGCYIDKLENIKLSENKAWGKSLSDIIDLFLYELKRQGMSEQEAIKSAPKLAAMLAHYFGGRSYYIPTGETLKLAIRDNAIFNDYKFGNGDIKLLADKYKLTDRQIYIIIKKQRALHQTQQKGVVS